MAPSRTARIRALARRDPARARAMLADLVSGLFAIPAEGVEINADRYSLNSLNGFFTSRGEGYFFKFHQEEGEEGMRGEYYRADILAHAGLPVDLPVHVSTRPGEQILIYRRRADPRFSDVLLALDHRPDAAAVSRALAAEAALNDRLLACARATLHPVTPAQAAAEPIHRLFHERLIDRPGNRYPGGRLARFYLGRDFAFPGGLRLAWDDIAHARPVIDGIEHRLSLAEAFDLAHRRLAPERLADAGGITAHGDAHNANVWYERGAGADRLTFFDPAFAGAHVPALLAEVKSTFHNIFAHPFWLYDPAEAARRFHATVRLEAGRLMIDTDWRLSPLRAGLARVKAAHFWAPWLETLAGAGMLPGDWEQVVRLGLFLSPMLVMDLRAAGGENEGEGGGEGGGGGGGERSGGHNPVSSAIGLAVALAAASPPRAGADMFSEFFDRIRPPPALAAGTGN